MGAFGAGTLGLGLGLVGVAARRGALGASLWLGSGRLDRGDRIYATVLLPLVAAGLWRTVGDNILGSWDGWSMLQGAGQLAGGLLLGWVLIRHLPWAR